MATCLVSLQTIAIFVAKRKVEKSSFSDFKGWKNDSAHFGQKEKAREDIGPNRIAIANFKFPLARIRMLRKKAPLSF